MSVEGVDESAEYKLTREVVEAAEKFNLAVAKVNATFAFELEIRLQPYDNNSKGAQHLKVSVYKRLASV